MHVGPIVSSDVFYNPDEGQYERWSSRGVLGVEMEAAALFTVAAIGGIGKVPDVHGGCLLTVSDIIVEGVFTRITDDELQCRGRPDDAHRAHDRHFRLALASLFLVNPASGNGATGKRWPKLRERAAELGLRGEEVLSEFPGHLAEAAGEAGDSLLVVIGGDGTVNEVANGDRRHGRRARSPAGRHGPGLRPHARDPEQLRRRSPGRARRRDARHRPRPGRVVGGEPLLRQRRLGRDERRSGAARELDDEEVRRSGDVLLRAHAGVPRLAEHQRRRRPRRTVSGAKGRCTT